jgi:uncharacterized protein (UPF0147 family)
MRITHGLCCSLFVIATVAATSHSAKVPKQVDVQFRFQESVVTLHEPVVLLFEVHNGMKQPITVTVGSLTRQFYDLTLTTPSGKVFHKDPFNGQVDIVTIGDGKIIVAPGADFARPVETAANADAAQEPARTLSYVEDPIAVPYLAKVLSTNTLTYNKAIAGLERIGNVDAAETLLSVVDNDNDVGEQARRSLTRMQDRIADPRLKDTVKRAVEHSSERARSEFIKTQIAYLDYRSPQLQEAAIQNLVRVQDGLQQAEPVLQRLANDPNQPPDVRAAAKDALQKLHSSER